MRIVLVNSDQNENDTVKEETIENKEENEETECDKSGIFGFISCKLSSLGKSIDKFLYNVFRVIFSIL